ncbi:MAG: PAS domain S-box protein [Pseudomonadota bacterium]
MSLHSFLTRLIWFCVLPLVLLASLLALDNVRSKRVERDLEATHMAKNFATAIDQDLKFRIGALNILALSPLADQPARWKDLYGEAQAFRQSFGSHVVFSDLHMHMLFNTRQPYGTVLPPVPRPKGRSAVQTVMDTGKPGVGDAFFGPIAKEPLVAIAVPVVREDKTAFMLLSTFETRQFQSRLDQLALPAGWSLVLRDSKGEAIARHVPAGFDSTSDVDASGRFTVNLTTAPWSVVLEVPRALYHAPLVSAAAAMIVMVLGATLAGVFGGVMASRRLGRLVASLANGVMPDAQERDIAEIAAVRAVLLESFEKRDKAEAARRDSERRFRATFEQAAVGIALVAPDGRWLEANQKLCDIVGYQQQELLGKTFQDITYADDLEIDLDNLQQVLAGQIDTYSMEKRYLRKDGERVWVNLTVALVRHADGNPDYFISVVEDIQRRKQTEAALQAREATLSEAQRLAGVGNWSWDIASDQHVWSAQIYHIYGRDLSLPPAVYPEVQTYFTPDSWAGLTAAVELCLKHGTSYQIDAEVQHPDGHRNWITARGEAIRDAAGTVVQLHGTVQDITERKQTAEALRELNANLEHRVELRTAELTAANKELDSFAYAVSHDLRAPLRAMNGFSQALIEDYGDRLDDEARHFLDQISIASRKMGELIDGILALSRSTRGELQRDVVNLSLMSANICVELARIEPERTVHVEIEPNLSVTGDSRMIEVVMRNLLGNAWKYTAKAPATLVRVYAGAVGAQHGICVSDNGAGFDMAHANQLFQPFRRLHRQEEFPGIGIGLATVQRIVSRHGGEICAVAALGEGATFCFFLPSLAASEVDRA